MPQTVISPEVQSLMTLILIALLLTMFYYAILRSLPPAAKDIFTTRTVIRCVNNDYEEVKGFERGMYVGKVLEERCPKCQSQLYIHRIYAESLISHKKGAGSS